jgi:hypothetical protein
MARVSDGCFTPQLLAARVKLPSSQMAKKYRTWCAADRRVFFALDIF